MAQVQAAYEDNSQYDVTGNVTMAREFIVAGRILIQRTAERSRIGDSELQMNVQVVRDEVLKAEQWLRANDETMRQGQAGVVRHFDMQEFRG